MYEGLKLAQQLKLMEALLKAQNHHRLTTLENPEHFARGIILSRDRRNVC
jgi:hypothetical protein